MCCLKRNARAEVNTTNQFSVRSGIRDSLSRRQWHHFPAHLCKSRSRIASVQGISSASSSVSSILWPAPLLPYPHAIPQWVCTSARLNRSLPAIPRCTSEPPTCHSKQIIPAGSADRRGGREDERKKGQGQGQGYRPRHDRDINPKFIMPTFKHDEWAVIDPNQNLSCPLRPMRAANGAKASGSDTGLAVSRGWDGRSNEPLAWGPRARSPTPASRLRPA